MVRSMRLLVALACATFAATAYADPRATCASAKDQGQRLREDGRYRASRERFITCTKSDCPNDISAGCAQRLHDLDVSMPSLVLSAKDPSGGDLTEVSVLFDGETLTTSLNGEAIVVDPGSHTLRFERAGSEPVERTIVIQVGEKNRGVAATLHPAVGTATVKSAPVPITHAPVTAPVPTTSAGEVAPAPAPETTPKSGADSSQTARFVIGGSLLGLAAGALATGIYFGVTGKNDSDQAAQLRGSMPAYACAGAGATTPSCQGLASAVNAQDREATITLAMYVVSGVLAAASVLSFVLWPKHKEPKDAWLVPYVGPMSTGAAIGGRF